MSTRDRYGKAATALGLAVLFLSVVGILYGITLELWSKQNDVYDRHQEHAEKQRSRTSEAISQECLAGPRDLVVACLEGKIEAHDREQETSEDLQAQQEMALWGLLVFVATAFSSGVTLAGVIYVARTLDATRDAVVAANRTNDIMRAEQRPWAVLRRETDAIFTVTEIDPSSKKGSTFRYDAYLRWKFRIENVGKSPAFAVRTKMLVSAAPNYFEARNDFLAFAAHARSKGTSDTYNTVFQGDDLVFEAFERYAAVRYDYTAPPTFYLFVAILYRSQEADLSAMEARLIEIVYDPRTLGPWPVKLLEFSRDRITT